MLIRDNRTESGTFQVDRNEALNPRTFYKYALGEGPVRLQTGDIKVEITEKIKTPQMTPNCNYNKIKDISEEIGVSVLEEDQGRDMHDMLGSITPLQESNQSNC